MRDKKIHIQLIKKTKKSMKAKKKILMIMTMITMIFAISVSAMPLYVRFALGALKVCMLEQNRRK